MSEDFSVRAYFSPNSTNSIQTICSTVNGTTGFRLYLDKGILKGKCYYQNPPGEAEVVDATGPLQTGHWYRVAFVAEQVEGTPNEQYLNLWRNSERVGSTNWQTISDIDNSTLDPVFGADRATGGFTNHLDARVYAVEAVDYALRDFFLSTPTIRDGGKYLGMPSYHDYIGDVASGTDNYKNTLEGRINHTYTLSGYADFMGCSEQEASFCNGDWKLILFSRRTQ